MMKYLVSIEVMALYIVHTHRAGLTIIAFVLSSFILRIERVSSFCLQSNNDLISLILLLILGSLIEPQSFIYITISASSVC